MAPLRAIAPYVPVVAPEYVSVSPSCSGPVMVPVTVDVDASSVSAPVASLPADGASLASTMLIVTSATSDDCALYAIMESV